MRFALLLALLAAPAAAQAVAPTTSAARADHVVIISIDGLRPEFYLDRTWPAPTVQLMAREGAHAKGVRTVFPSVTYPSHTTLVTGALPARHGVLFNTPFEPAGETGRWYWEADAIKVPTLWDALESRGRRVAALSWPVTVGANIAWNVPEVWSLGQPTDPLAVVREHSTPGLWETLEREVTGRLTPERLDLENIERDDLVGAMAAWVLKERRPALLLVHLIMVDHWQHEEGRQGKTVPRALAAIDRCVGKLVDAAVHAKLAPRTAFIVTGDHGFCDIHTQLRPNVWLAEAGLQEASRTRGAWRATFHASGASAFLRLADPDDQAAVAAARAAIAKQPAGVRRLFRIVERAELDRLGADPEAALALAPIPGITFSSNPVGPAVREATGGTHGYAAEDTPEIATGFVGWGPAFREGAVVPRMGLEDVAPLAAELLGVPFDAPDGVAPKGILAKAP